MFKLIFELATEPLGLPIEWYYEWIILLVINEIAYQIACDKVGILYHNSFISGEITGSFVHWMIRSVVFVAIWAITYGVIWIWKFVMLHKLQVIIGICSIVAVVTIAKLLIWIKKRSKSVKAAIKDEADER